MIVRAKPIITSTYPFEKNFMKKNLYMTGIHNKHGYYKSNTVILFMEISVMELFCNEKPSQMLHG